MPELKSLIQQLKKLPILSPKYCDNCGAKHSHDDSAYVGHSEGNFLFQITCSHCGLGYVMRVNPSAGGLAAQKLDLANLDLNPAEMRKFAGKPKVNKQEALSVYSAMREVRNIDDFLRLVA